MKKIEAVIQPYKLDEAKEAVLRAGGSGLTITEVAGFGRQRGHSELYRGAEYEIKTLVKVKVEVVVHDDLVERVVAALLDAARTGRFGDGKIFVSDVAEAVRIRTHEQDEAAIA